MPRSIVCSFVLTSLITATCAVGNVAFFYAVEDDLDALKSQADTTGRTEVVGRSRISQFTIGAHTVFAVKMGAGCVETAINAQALLSTRRCDLAISVGPVGALHSALKVGDWGLVREVVAYQRGSQTPGGYLLAKGTTTTLPEVSVLLQHSSESLRKFAVEDFFVASGEIFSASDIFRSELHAEFSTNTIDMNLWGLLSACADHEVPLIALRIVSDQAGDSASEQFAEFTKNYRGEGGDFIAKIIRELPKNPASPESYDALQKLLDN